MSDSKKRITITVDPQLAEYAEKLVATGKAESVSAAFNAAMAARRRQERRGLALLREKAAQADPVRVARMTKHVEDQARAQGFQVDAGE